MSTNTDNHHQISAKQTEEKNDATTISMSEAAQCIAESIPLLTSYRKRSSSIVAEVKLETKKKKMATGEDDSAPTNDLLSVPESKSSVIGISANGEQVSIRGKSDRLKELSETLERLKKEVSSEEEQHRKKLTKSFHLWNRYLSGLEELSKVTDLNAAKEKGMFIL